MKRGCRMDRDPSNDVILPRKRSSSALARPGRSKHRRRPPRSLSPCVRSCTLPQRPASFHATHGVSEERRGTLLDPATPTTCILRGCGGSTGWRGGYPWGASCKERPGCFWNTGQPTPHVNVSLQHICGGMRSAFSAGGSDGPSPRRCSRTTTVLPVPSPVSLPAQRVRALLLFAWPRRMACGIHYPVSIYCW